MSSDFLVLPDTNVVIGKSLRKDNLHLKSIDALGIYPPKDVKILGAVYQESSEWVQENTSKSLWNVKQAYVELRNKKIIDGDDISPEAIDKVIKAALKLGGGRHEGLYNSLPLLMNSLADKQANPFFWLDQYAEAAIFNNFEIIHTNFNINRENPNKDLIGPKLSELPKLKEIELSLMKRIAFFNINEKGRDNHSRDREIFCQMLIISMRDDARPIIFLTDDDDFIEAFDELRANPPLELAECLKKVEFRHI